MEMPSKLNRSSNNSDQSDTGQDPESRKRPRHSFAEKVENTVSEYTRRSTIHGISYIGDNERHPFERLWWFIMFAGSVFGAFYLIYQAYKTMTESPIIESSSLNPVPLWEIPFPAITFCPASNGLTPFGRNKTNWPEFVHKFFPTTIDDLPAEPVFFVNLLLRRSHLDNYDILRKIFPEIDVNKAIWMRNTEEKDVTLDKTITHLGPCRTFNMYNEKDLMRDGVILSSRGKANDDKEPQWSRDFGFKTGLQPENYTYPFRSFGIADFFFISFNVNQLKRNLEFHSKIEVFIHTPDESPIQTRHCSRFVIDANEYSFIKITPHLIASEGIEKYEPSVRRCYYAAERHLKYFKLYTQNYCEWECATNYTLAHCGCVPYPSSHFNTTNICVSVEDSKCFFKAERQLYTHEFLAEKNDLHAPIDDCDCLPTCTQLLYAVQVTKWDDVNGENLVRFQYARPFFKKDTRSVLHSLSEFFSNSGGSLGLFLGVSVFSICELCYFCSVRLYLHSKRLDRRIDSKDSKE